MINYRLPPCLHTAAAAATTAAAPAAAAEATKITYGRFWVTTATRGCSCLFK